MQYQSNGHTLPSAQRDFRVAIVGGGMCGLTLAIVLARAGIDIQLFESSVSPRLFMIMMTVAEHSLAQSNFSEIGASVTFGRSLRYYSCDKLAYPRSWSGANALRAFEMMGLLDGICESTGQKPAIIPMFFTLQRDDGEQELGSWVRHS